MIMMEVRILNFSDNTMATQKYISTKDAMRLTSLSKQEIYDLIHEGKLPARKAPKSGWRISLLDLEQLGLSLLMRKIKLICSFYEKK